MGGDALANFFGHYELQALVGRGGMAEVYRAMDLAGPRQGRLAAIKRLMPALAKDEHYLDMFITEADLSRMLRHPNIVEVYEAGEIGGQYYMAMEYIDGRDLGQVVRRCRERNILLPVDFAVYLGVTLLDALAYAHEAKSPSGKPLEVVHCDISPSNLFVSRNGEVKLGDFGIAKGGIQREDDNKVWGKAYYLSPECIDGKVDRSADLWAATATVYELLTNERPFQGKDPDAVVAAIKKASPKPIRALRPEVSPELERAVMKGFSKKLKDRYPDAGSFAAALKPHYNELIGNPMAIASVVRGLFGG